jgi:hypothetical protein
MIQQNQLHKDGQQNEKQKQQQPMKKPTEWSMDLTSICGNGNGQNAGLPFPKFGLDAHHNMPSLLSSSIVDDGIKNEPKVQLEERELWQKLHAEVNEMIITKTGRSVEWKWNR